jgi:tetratricopeptide (TPR) repeat protein
MKSDPRTAFAILLVTASVAVAQDASRSRIEREASAQAAQADKLFKVGRFEAALKLYRAEADSRKALGDTRYEAYAHRGAGCCLERMKDDEAAIDAFRAAMAIDDGRDDPGFAGYDGLLLAQAQVRLGRPAEAVESLAKALPRLGQAVDRDHECDARLCLVQARLALGEAAKALPDATRALALARELDDPQRLANAWLGLGLTDRGLGHLGPALMRLQDARDAYHDQSREADDALAARHLADVAYRLGDRGRAAALFEEAAALHAKLNDTAAEADDRLDLASVRLDLGDAIAAAREAERARDGFLAGDDEGSAIDAMVVLAKVQSLSKGKDALAAAAATIRGALDRSARVHGDAPAERIRLLLLSADLEGRLGRKAEVSSRLSEAGKLAESANDPLLRSAVAQARGRLNP